MNTGSRGRLCIVGIGPGDPDLMTLKARAVIESSDTIVGYTKYIDLIGDILKGKKVISTGMTREIQRCILAIEDALKGNTVSLVCSGDPGIYAMAGLVFEIIKEGYSDALSGMDISIVPGVTALTASAALLGAPLMHDFATISLSDRLTPWDLIEKRLYAASEADFVIALYNPRSRGRRDHLRRAVEIVLEFRSPSTPAGVVRAATRDNEEVIITRIDSIPYDLVDMESTVIIGNSETFVWDRFVITPRGYNKKYSRFDGNK